MKCLGLPLGQATLSGEARPCAGSQAPFFPPQSMSLVSWRQSLRRLSAHTPPPPPPPSPACSWLRSLCSQVASVPAVCFDAPSGPWVWKHGRPDYLSDPQTAAGPAPSPRCRAREQRSDARSHGAARPARAEGPAAAPLRPGFQARNQPVWAWQWTYLSYCEVLFMKNLEGEGRRQASRESGAHPFPHPGRTPAPWATLAHPQGTLTPEAASLQNPALLLQGLSRPTFVLVKGQSVPRGPSCPVLGPLGVGAEGCRLLSQGGVAWEKIEELTLFSQ